MPQMQILQVAMGDRGYTHITKFLLLEEQQQRIMLLQLNDHMLPGPMRTTSQQDATIAEPLTIDFLVNVLHALGGTIEEITLDTLPGDLLYAHIHLRDQYGRQMIKAPLNDALSIAQREHSKISVPSEILDQRSVNLADYGTTLQQQLATVERLAEQDPNALRPTPGEPRNLDFSDGLRYWSFSRSQEYGSYALDPQMTYAGKASLAITLHKPFTHGSAGILSHERFLANQYRGQRIRLIAHVKVENIHQPIFELKVSESVERISPLTGSPIRAGRLTRSRITGLVEGSEWVRHELVIDVPNKGHDISFSLGTYEQGKIWLNGIQIETVDQSVPLTGTLLRPPPRQPLNLDFSNNLEYWSIEGNMPWRYECGLDTTLTTRTTASAYLKATAAAQGDSCSLQQMISAEDYQGKRVHFSTNIKTLDVEPQASLFIGEPIAGRGDRIEETIKGTTEWTPYTLSWKVPQDSQGLLGSWGLLHFGVSLHGKGQVWLEGASLEMIEDQP